MEKNIFGKYPPLDCHKIPVTRIFGGLDLYTWEDEKRAPQEGMRKKKISTGIAQ